MPDDHQWWLATFNFYGPVTGNGSRTFGTKGDVPDIDFMRSHILQGLQRDTGHSQNAFTVTFSRLYKLADDNNYL